MSDCEHEIVDEKQGSVVFCLWCESEVVND
jgi:hypothetical protein